MHFLTTSCSFSVSLLLCRLFVRELLVCTWHVHAPPDFTHLCIASCPLHLPNRVPPALGFCTGGLHARRLLQLGRDCGSRGAC
jgi:hypothetical protein